MGKWLAIAGALLLVLLVLMWRSMDSAATPSVAQPVEKVAALSPSSATPSVKPVVTNQTTPASTDVPVVESVTDKPEKLDPMGDEFFHKFIDFVPNRLSRDAAECYLTPGAVHRNQKLVLKFDMRVRDGVVTVQNMKVDQSTLNNPALESCFIQKVSRVTWKDDALPDYDWPDELVIRPERGLKKHWKSNIEYVGEPAPKKDFSVHPGPK